MRRELIREIKFPEPVYSVSFLNEEGDILIGHKGKVSMVSCEDYVPDENKRLFQPNIEELENFYKRKSQLADNDLYLKIKLMED